MTSRNELAQVQEILSAAPAGAEEIIVPELEEETSELEAEGVAVAELEAEGEEELELDATDEEEAAAATEAGASDDEPYTMASLADAIELDQAELYKVLIPLDEGAEPISIGEIKNKFQNLAREKTALETQLAEASQGAQQGQQLSQEEINATIEMQMIQKQYADIDWTEEEAYDAGAAALKRQKFQEQFNTAQQKLGFVQQQRTAEQQTHLAAANTKMLELIPTWQDATVRTADTGKMNELLIGAGYTQEIINHIDDPIAMSLIRELMTLRAEKKTAGDVLLKAKKTPKVLKKTGQFAVKKANVADQLAVKARKTGRRQDAEAAVKAILSGQ